MRFCLLLLPLGLLLGCQPGSRLGANVQVHDDLGRALTLPAQPRRVLALVPSMTEILYAVADTATIIARVPQDNYHAAVLRKPVVSNYPLDMEKLELLHPAAGVFHRSRCCCWRPVPRGAWWRCAGRWVLWSCWCRTSRAACWVPRAATICRYARC